MKRKSNNGEVVLFLTSSDKYASTNIKLLKEYVSKDNYIVYMTVNKPYMQLLDVFKKSKIDSKNIFVVDAITPVGNSAQRVGNVVFVGSPRGLTTISIAITSALKSLPENKRVLFLDSMTTLEVYNDLGNLTKFSQFIVSKMREWKVSTALISLQEGKDSKLINEMSQFVDKVVKL